MSYAQLTQQFQRIHHLEHVAAYASWDEAVNMPPGGGPARAEALATLAVLVHDLYTAPELGDWLAAAETSPLDTWQQANVVAMRRLHTRAVVLPSRLVQALSLAASRCEQAWRVMRPANDWTSFVPLLEEVVSRKREAATALGEALDLRPYDALLDEYEPGARTEWIDPIFAELNAFLPQAIATAVERQATEPPEPLAGPFSVEAQRMLGLELMRATGFDFEHGRLDTSHHPFCGGTPTDVRITTRYDPDDFLSALMGVLHETGHAKYEQGLPAAWLEQPVGRALGMAMHESQSLLQEMQLCRSPAFWRYAGPLVRRTFAPTHSNSAALSDDNLMRLVTRVRPGKIRVDADEVTYPCHVILRYEIEKQLVAGTLDVADVPEQWAVRMRDALGVDTAGNYRDGCMQDVHWPAGAIGYFPTYTLGALIAAQLAQALRRALPDGDQLLAHGEFEPINAWLRQHVWSQGSLKPAAKLLEDATGQPLSGHAFRQHITTRYLERA